MRPHEASCQGKAGFLTLKLAMQITRRRKRTGTHDERHCYHYSHCKQWHLGNNFKPKRGKNDQR